MTETLKLEINNILSNMGYVLDAEINTKNEISIDLNKFSLDLLHNYICSEFKQLCGYKIRSYYNKEIYSFVAQRRSGKTSKIRKLLNKINNSNVIVRTYQDREHNYCDFKIKNKVKIFPEYFSTNHSKILFFDEFNEKEYPDERLIKEFPNASIRYRIFTP